MCINRCAYIYLSIYRPMCIYIYMPIYICPCIHRSIYLYRSMYTQVYLYIYIYVYIYLYICLYLYIYTCVYRCTNLYVYKSIYPHIIYIFVCFFEDSSLCAASRPQEALQGFDNSENTADSLPVFDGVKHPSIFSHDDSTESMTSNFFLISAVPYEQIFTRKKGGSQSCNKFTCCSSGHVFCCLVKRLFGGIPLTELCTSFGKVLVKRVEHQRKTVLQDQENPRYKLHNDSPSSKTNLPYHGCRLGVAFGKASSGQ